MTDTTSRNLTPEELDRLAATPCCQPKPARCYYTVEPEDWTALLAMARECLEYRHAIVWDTNCKNCARQMDKSVEGFFDERNLELECERDALRARVEELEIDNGLLRAGLDPETIGKNSATLADLAYRHAKLVEAAMDFANEADGCWECSRNAKLEALRALLADEGTKG